MSQNDPLRTFRERFKAATQGFFLQAFGRSVSAVLSTCRQTDQLARPAQGEEPPHVGLILGGMAE
jgi:hypothetical protein